MFPYLPSPEKERAWADLLERVRVRVRVKVKEKETETEPQTN
jgi:hypothetical protein